MPPRARVDLTHSIDALWAFVRTERELSCPCGGRVALSVQAETARSRYAFACMRCAAVSEWFVVEPGDRLVLLENP